MSIIDDLNIGDYVIVSNKIIVSKVPKEEAIKCLELINESGKENERISEKYFFKYAFPCTYLKLDRKDIAIEKYQELEKRFLENNPPDRKVLEKIYAPAFIYIKELAIKMKKDIWNFEVIVKYWKEEHNNIINQGKGNYMDAPEFLRDYCKTQIARIIKKDEKRHLLTVTYNGKERTVFDYLVPNAKVDDKVIVHHTYAIEKVN
jgi:hydrogenase maturation factor